MPLSGMLTCGNCGSRTQMSTMRYNLPGTKLICQSCVDKERSGIKPGTTQSSARLQRGEPMRGTLRGMPSSSTMAEPTAAEPRIGGSEMTGYVCRSCHFKFSRKKDMDIISCPYCNRQTVSPQYTGGAQDLIEESMKAQGDRFERF